jgi:hypothetical protein
VSAPFDELTASRRAFIARASLTELDAVLGRPGRAAAADRPEIVSQVDQHAAAIRDALGGRSLDPVALAGYAAAILDLARTSGDRLGEWSQPTWAMVRLLAVCQLA